MEDQRLNPGGCEDPQERIAQLQRILIEVINKRDGHLSELQEGRRDCKTFVCPHCGERHNIAEAVIVDEITDTKSAGTTFSGRAAIHKYVDTHHKVRFCPKCAKKRANIRKCLTWLLYGIFPVGFLILWITHDIMVNENNVVGDVILLIGEDLLMTFIATLFLAIPVELIANLYFKIDVNKAAEGNALANPFYDF